MELRLDFRNIYDQLMYHLKDRFLKLYSLKTDKARRSVKWRNGQILEEVMYSHGSYKH